MDTIFMNSKNSETSYSHRLLLNVADKLNFIKFTMLLYHILTFTIQRDIYKSHNKKDIQK